MTDSSIPMNHNDASSEELRDQLVEIKMLFSNVIESLDAQLLGLDTAIELLCINLLAGGHALLEGPPGVGKTTLVQAFAQQLALSLNRVQFTPDLMPLDLLGGEVINQQSDRVELHWKPGPIFTQLLFIDEINRSGPRTQSALLEAMAERQVSAIDQQRQLDPLFTVLATQNSLDLEGTYPLPDAQSDRFMMKLLIPPPSHTVLRMLLERSNQTPVIQSKITSQQLIDWRTLRQKVRCAERLKQALVQFTVYTRPNQCPPDFKIQPVSSISPRAMLDLFEASKARALIKGRLYVSDEDLLFCVLPCIRHRIKLSWNASIDLDSLIISLMQRAIDTTAQ